MRAPFVLLLLLSLTLGAMTPLPSVAQSDEPPLEAGSTRHLSRIAETLERIADLLERQQQGSRLELVMRRIDLRQRQLAPLEARLRSARSTRDNDLTEQYRLQSHLEDMANRLAEGEVENNPGNLRMLTDSYESELELLAQRLRSAEREIATLENEVSRHRREIEDWEAWVDREIGGL